MRRNYCLLVFLVLIGIVNINPLAYAPSTTAFTYQGELKDGGKLANGLYDLQFTLYEDATTGSVVAGPFNAFDVTVTNGLFSTVVDFGSSAFNGGDRWMEIAVSPSSKSVKNSNRANYTVLSPRQKITPTPYAIYSPPPVPMTLSGNDANWILKATNASNTTLAAGIVGQSTATSEITAGVYGQSDSSTGIGVWGVATDSTGNATGVLGETNALTGAAVLGRANSATGANYGVEGQISSNDINSAGVRGVASIGMGVSGESTSGAGVNGSSTSGAGVYGTTHSSDSGAAGIYGYMDAGAGSGVYGKNAAGSTFGNGVTGKSNSTQGAGVYGSNDTSIGVWGYSNTGKGIYGQSDSGSGVYGVGSTGVYGVGSIGLDGSSAQTNGIGVQGQADSGTSAVGVKGNSSQGTGGEFEGGYAGVQGISGGAGVYGISTNGTGVLGVTSGAGQYGVSGLGNNNAGGATSGVCGETKSTYNDVTGVFGFADDTSHRNYGLHGSTNSGEWGSAGVYGYEGAMFNISNQDLYGVKGESAASNYGYGVYGVSPGYLGSGVYGYSTGELGKGVTGKSSGAGGYGVYGCAEDSASVGVLGNGPTWDFYASGTGKYGPFTGAHEAMLDASFSANAKPGMIVCTTGESRLRKNKDGRVNLSSTLPTVRLEDKPNDKTVFGILDSVSDSLIKDHWYKAKAGEKFAIINALGDGRVWVTDANGPITNGDYITTSNIPGYGQRQDDDLLHSYTLGKATESVDWDKVKDTITVNGKTVKIYLIGVVYKSG